MNRNWIYWLLGLFIVSVLFSIPQGWAQPRPGTKVPIITHSFAVDKGYFGYIWKIYIEAEDPDGEMLRIALTVDQPGNGRYPTDWIYLRPEYQKHFKGYIQWNTFSSKASYLTEWKQITLKVSVFDKAGNESNEVVFPFTFESGVKDPYKYALPVPFNEGNIPKLGNIFIDLYEPSLMGGDPFN
jgi:hypothetical protein